MLNIRERVGATRTYWQWVRTAVQFPSMLNERDLLSLTPAVVYKWCRSEKAVGKTLTLSGPKAWTTQEVRAAGGYDTLVHPRS